MRCAYASQNYLGRLCDERVYENDLALRLKADGFREVHTQVPVIVSHGDFEKTYRLDLLADDALYELKTVAALTGEHDAQALHYAMLLGIRHAKLINFRPPRVQGRLRFNAIEPDQRRRPAWILTDWSPLSPSCARLKERFQALVSDWGTFLDSRLYEEALVRFLGGEDCCVRHVPVVRDGVQLGTHRLQFHDGRCCFSVTAIAANVPRYTRHLRQLLRATGQIGLQWMNFEHEQVRLVTLTPESDQEVDS